MTTPLSCCKSFLVTYFKRFLTPVKTKEDWIEDGNHSSKQPENFKTWQWLPVCLQHELPDTGRTRSIMRVLLVETESWASSARPAHPWTLVLSSKWVSCQVGEMRMGIWLEEHGSSWGGWWHSGGEKTTVLRRLGWLFDVFLLLLNFHFFFSFSDPILCLGFSSNAKWFLAVFICNLQLFYLWHMPTVVTWG